MADLSFNGNIGLSNGLMNLLMSDDLVPGETPSYQLAKDIYTLHPLGSAIVDRPLQMALGKPRIVSVPDSPEDVCTKAFEDEWRNMKCDAWIMNTMRLARIYGISAVIMRCDAIPDEMPIPPEDLWKLDLNFMVYDPLNLAGSMVLDLNPLSMHFLKPTIARVSGKPFHPSRTCVQMYEDPVYLAWTASAFGYVGRSIYQRCLYPLKSFISTMIADNMTAVKAGALVAKIKSPGSIINEISKNIWNEKRNYVKQAETNNVISIGLEEEVTSIDLTNIEGPLSMARQHIIKNIAIACGMPEHILSQEKLSNGFESGGEDAAAIADYVSCIQKEMEDLFEFFTKICQRRAWNPQFFQSVQALYPEEYAGLDYESFFYQSKNKFTSRFPELIEEREEKRLDQEKLKCETIVNVSNALMPSLDPNNQAILLNWVAENLNSLKVVFNDELEFDALSLIANAEKMQMQEQQAAAQAEQEGSPFGGDPDKSTEVADDSHPKLFIAGGKTALEYE